MFRQLKIYYLFVSLPFALLLVGATIFFDGIKYTIVRNPHPQINYTIFVIILVGGLLILLNTRRLLREARVIVEFFHAVHSRDDWPRLQELANRYTGETACLLQMVSTSGGRAISHQEQVAIEHELANSRSSLLRRNALPQYLTGLLVGMGLLGTFIGLLATLNDISLLINSFAELDMQNASPLLVFRTMIERMKAPMQSMGIAFSASMFGLLGSIVLGLMMVGLRRLQGDMFSVLSSEIARHIEIALSHESKISGQFTGGAAVAAAPTDVTKALFRIEERYAEAARSQQRAFSTLVDDMQRQRTDMLRALTEQAEANNNFRLEIQQVGRQLGHLSGVMEKGGHDMSTGFADLSAQMSGDVKEVQKLLAAQLDEQQQLRSTLDSYQIDERLAEATRTQQGALSSFMEDLQQQRAEMLRTLTEQSETNSRLRSELQQFGSHLGALANVVEQGRSELSAQVSDLTVHMAADAKETHLLLDSGRNDLNRELQQLVNQLAAVSTALADGKEDFGKTVNALVEAIHADVNGLQTQLGQGNTDLRSELQELGTKLDIISNVTWKGHEQIKLQISELLTGLSGAAMPGEKSSAQAEENPPHED